MTPRTVALLAAALLLAALTLGVGAPAQATPDFEVIGHRCKSAPWPNGSNENTVYALKQIASINTKVTIRCETDFWLAANSKGEEAAGPPVDYHDEEWEPKANSATLSGVPARVPDTTPEQISQIRYDGGQPVPMLKRMIVASGAQGMPLVAEWKWDMSDWAERIMRWARREDAVFWAYGIRGMHNCLWHNVNAFRRAGAYVGLKGTRCGTTPESAQNHGVDFISLPWKSLTTRWSVRRWTTRGIDVISGGVPPSKARKAYRRGVRGTIVANPRGYVRQLKEEW